MEPRTAAQVSIKKRVEKIFDNLNAFKKSLASKGRNIQVIGLFQQLIQAFAKLTLDYDPLLRARIVSIRKTV
ncbi:hypothetical protein J4467_00760 [Candidatus Woesearchaeota archaeon]|nr:hypothetical protein [Candidatus Woesearchaeota archaeon]